MPYSQIDNLTKHTYGQLFFLLLFSAEMGHIYSIEYLNRPPGAVAAACCVVAVGAAVVFAGVDAVADYLILTVMFPL